MKWLLRGALVPVLIIGLYLLAATIGGVIPGPVADIVDAPANRRIGLVTSPIHTDVLLPLDDATRAAFGFATRAGVPLDLAQAEWVAVGWGGRAFYTTTGTYLDLSAATVLKSVFGDAAVLRVDAIPAIPPDHPAVRYLDVSQPQIDALIGIILSDLSDAAALDTPGFNATDAFFPAKGRFQIWRTCNAWLGEALRAAGIPAGIWTPVNWSLP